jgi:phage tail-like protein
MADVKLVTGGVRDTFIKHQFLVQIVGGFSATFQKCSELSMEIAKIEYHEGGNMIPWKLPGRVTIPDVTLERGASQSKKFYNWMMQLANVHKGTGKLQRGAGAKLATYLKQVTIFQLDRDADMQSPLRKWTLDKAWPLKYVAGDWDASTDEVVIESITLAFDTFALDI